MLQWLQDWWTDAKDWIHGVWNDFVDWASDFFIGLADSVLDAIAGLIQSIPTPDFLTGSSLQTYLNGIDPAVLYFLSVSGFATACALVGSAVVFRLLRKLATLGQW